MSVDCLFLISVMKDGDLANIFLLRMSDEATKNMNVDLSKDIVEDNVIATAFKELLDEFLPSQKQQPQQNVRPDSNKGKVRIFLKEDMKSIHLPRLICELGRQSQCETRPNQVKSL